MLDKVMRKIALIVDFRLADGMKNRFLERVKKHAVMCLEREDECLRFDVIVPQDSDDHVILYEVYANRNALSFHDLTPYMEKFREDISVMLNKRTRTVCEFISG